MKKLMMLVCIFCLGVSTQAQAQNVVGGIDSLQTDRLIVWAINLNNKSSDVCIRVQDSFGGQVWNGRTSKLRQDINSTYGVSGFHGAEIVIPVSFRTGKTQEFVLFASESTTYSCFPRKLVDRRVITLPLGETARYIGRDFDKTGLTSTTPNGQTDDHFFVSGIDSINPVKITVTNSLGKKWVYPTDNIAGKIYKEGPSGGVMDLWINPNGDIRYTMTIVWSNGSTDVFKLGDTSNTCP